MYGSFNIWYKTNNYLHYLSFIMTSACTEIRIEWRASSSISREFISLRLPPEQRAVLTHSLLWLSLVHWSKSHKYHFGWVAWSHKKWGANLGSWLPYWQQSLNWQPVCERLFRKERIGCAGAHWGLDFGIRENLLWESGVSTCYCSCLSGWKREVYSQNRWITLPPDIAIVPNAILSY